MLAAMPARLIFPQGVFQGSKTGDWIHKPWVSKPLVTELRMPQESSFSEQVPETKGEQQQDFREEVQSMKENSHAEEALAAPPGYWGVEPPQERIGANELPAQSEWQKVPKQTKVNLKRWQRFMKIAVQEPSAFSIVDREFQAKVAVEAAILKAKQAAKLNKMKQEPMEFEQVRAAPVGQPEAKRSRSDSICRDLKAIEGGNYEEVAKRRPRFPTAPWATKRRERSESAESHSVSIPRDKKGWNAYGRKQTKRR